MEVPPGVQGANLGKLRGMKGGKRTIRASGPYDHGSPTTVWGLGFGV